MPIDRVVGPGSGADVRTPPSRRGARGLPAVAGAALALLLAAAPAAQAGHHHHHHHRRHHRHRAERYIFLVTHIGADKEKVPAAVKQQVRARLGVAIGKSNALQAALPPGAPDPNAAPKKFKKFLAARHLRAFDVTVHITDYHSEVVSLPAPSHGHQVVVRIALRLFGETIPGKWMGFNGHGSSTIKVGTGRRVRSQDLNYAHQQAIDLAVADAIKTSLAKLRHGG